MIDLHLVSWNRPKMTELVIRTIHKNTKPENFRLVVWDNASHEDTMQMLGDMHDNGLIDEITFSDKNYGLEFARQKLLEKTDSEYFICVDNDCLAPLMIEGRDWIDRLVELMQKYEDFAAIACRTQVMIGTGNIFEEADRIHADVVEFPHPGGSLRIMRTGPVQVVGGWDRDSTGRGAEERFIGTKLREVGYKTAFATSIRTLHLFGARNQTAERWGYADGMIPEETGHSDIDHPALRNGDDYEEVALYSGNKLAKEYFNA